jgi:hypothetical protein
MRDNRSASRGASRCAISDERGYAMLMVMFMATVLLIAATAASVNHLTKGKRERETELAWRGNQYVRAIQLYFKKNGRLPKSLEDLTKYTTDQPRYIRKAYKDPMSTDDDGGWRFIYLGPGGTLINGVMHKRLYAGTLPGPPPQQGQPGGGIGNPPGGIQPPGGINPPGSGGTPQQPPGQPPNPNQPGQGPGGPTTGGPIFGGQLIGVASKVEKDSIRVYEGGDTYFKWEFIWDPTKPANNLAQGNQPGGPQKPPPGPGTGQNPPQNPPQNP